MTNTYFKNIYILEPFCYTLGVLHQWNKEIVVQDYLIPIGIVLLLACLIFWGYQKRKNKEPSASYKYRNEVAETAEKLANQKGPVTLEVTENDTPGNAKPTEVVSSYELPSDVLNSPPPAPAVVPKPVEPIHVADARDEVRESFSTAYKQAQLSDEMQSALNSCAVINAREHLPQELIGGCHLTISLGDSWNGCEFRVFVWRKVNGVQDLISNPRAGNWAGIFFGSVADGNIIIPLDAKEWAQALSFGVALLNREASTKATRTVEIVK